MKSLFLFSICIVLFTVGSAQDNNSSISEDLKKIWNPNNTASSDDIYPIDGLMTNNDPGTGNGTDNVIDAPVDGGVGFLMAAGVLYGARRLRKRSSKSGANV